MGNFIWRSFIVMIIFIAGLLIGNIFAPKQILEEKDIIAVVEPRTSLDLNIEDNFEALHQVYDVRELFAAFLRQDYQKTKKEYEHQLENLNKNDHSYKDFMKAQKNYLAIINYIEQNYPLKEDVQVPQNDEPTEQESLQQENPEQTSDATENTQTPEQTNQEISEQQKPVN